MVPLWQKLTLSVAEASELSGIGQKKIRKLAEDPLCPFVLFVGKNIRIKREQFNEYLKNNNEI